MTESGIVFLGLKFASVNKTFSIEQPQSGPLQDQVADGGVEAKCHTRMINYSLLNQEMECSRFYPWKIVKSWD